MKPICASHFAFMILIVASTECTQLAAQTSSTAAQPIHQSPISDSTRSVLGSQRAKDAVAALKKKRIRKTREETYVVTKYEEEQYWQTYSCNGCIFKRLCIRWRPVKEQRTRTVAEDVPAIPSHTLFDDPTDPRVGEFTAIVDLNKVPNAAGGRASRISTLIQKQIPSSFAETRQNDDRALVLQSVDFSSAGAPIGKERKFRVVALVDENNADRIIGLTVLVLERDAGSQLVEDNKISLNNIAKQVGTVAAAEFQK